MLKVKVTNKFKRDSKQCLKRGLPMNDLKAVIHFLENQIQLEEKYRNHALGGDYQGHMECHIHPDWLLIYKIDENYLYLIRTGTHADLFK